MSRSEAERLAQTYAQIGGEEWKHLHPAPERVPPCTQEENPERYRWFLSDKHKAEMDRGAFFKEFRAKLYMRFVDGFKASQDGTEDGRKS